jgi:hypothetical protein
MSGKDKQLKSAYELAMERLKAKDREQGIEESVPLTDAQKRRIAELRQEAKAKRAEVEILREQRFAETEGDPEKLEEEKRNYETDLRRIDAWLDEAIAGVKSG